MKFIRAAALLLVAVLVGRLAWVQIVWGPQLSAVAQEQRKRFYVDSARRGQISDAAGAPLAYTMQARSLTVSPVVLRKEVQARHEADPKEYKDIQGTFKEISEEVPKMVASAGASADQVKPEEILQKLNKDSHYEVLVRNVDPDVAAKIAKKFPGIAADHQAIRQYPNGAIGENILGKVSMDGDGQFGMESANNDQLAGQDGKTTSEVSTNGQEIPGTNKVAQEKVDGSNIQLTLDLNLQTYVQQQLQQAKEKSLAGGASAVVLDAKTGQVKAMANSDTIDPTGDVEKQLSSGKKFGNPAISNPFEPGSVAKIMTASAAIEEKKTSPDEVLQVPGSIRMAGVTVKDAWNHGTVPYTTTGVFGKSSNVGTLMLADRVGPDAFSKYLQKFGVGQQSGIELPSESEGLVPDRDNWGGGTFANLPIGQGMSLTLLQMAGVYQTIANDGQRIQPRIIDSITHPDGTKEKLSEPEKTQVVSPETAKTVRDMFQAIVQRDPTGVQQGTAPDGAVDGYQISAKTGTAQQIDPACNCYSNSKYWITFAGIAPADNPRYVVAIMLDNPQRGVHGEGGQTAAPLFHDIATWLMNHENIPLSPPPAGRLVLQAN